jgi:antitoxin MazE
MIKKLTRHGNSSALVIDRPILELLKIDFETALEVSTDGRRLIIEPVVDNPRRKKFEAAMDKSHKKFAKVFKRLAE